jgi:nucleoside-diphosphate-sugar epimerase
MGKVSTYACVKPWKTSRARSAKLAIVGCGDVGLRLAKQLAGRIPMIALGRNPTIVNGARFIPLDLDRRHHLKRALNLAQWAVYLAPPPAAGADDARMQRFIAAAGNVTRCVYVSTTGVYGAAQGAWVSETSPLRPTEARGLRRLAAEKRLKHSAIPAVSILRAPGIYAAERLPLERLQKGLPALIAADDVPTNHIHADDLARLCWLALYRGRNRRAYNAADGQPMMHGDYLSAVASTFGLPAPPRLPREQAQAALSPIAWSMLAGARRVNSARLLSEWGVALKYPTMAAFLAQLKIAPAAQPLSAQLALI